MAAIAEMQLGKNGITEGFFETLKNHFKHHKNVKISVLKSHSRERLALKEMKEKILDRLGENYSGRIIGYTIAIKKLKRD